MASDQAYVDYIVDQLSAVPGVSARKMFGEYAIYVGAKVVALVCDNTLFVKPTRAGRQFIGTPVEAPAYPGAKASFAIRDDVENREWLCRLVALTCLELPEPKPRRKARPRLK